MKYINIKQVCKYVGLPYCRAKTYTGRITCYPLESHGKYADGTDRQTDGRQTITLCFPLDVASIMNTHKLRNTHKSSLCSTAVLLHRLSTSS